MANPIKSSDLYKDDGAILNAIAQLEQLQKQYKRALKDISKQAIQLKVNLQKVNATTSDQRKEIEKASGQTDKLQKAYKRYQDSLDETNQELQRLRKETSKNNRLAKLQAKLADAAEGSYDKLSAQYSLNKARLNAMTKAQREAAEESENLVTNTKAIYEEMKRLQAETGKTALNVGNYKDSFKDAISETLGFNRALNVLKANPIVLVITTLVAGVAALGKAFTRTKRGSDLLNRAQGILSGIMSELVGVVDDLAGWMIKAFEDPQQAAKDLWRTIKKEIVDRFNGLGLAFQAIGKQIQAALKFDWDTAREGAKELGQALTQITTGVTAEEMANLRKEIESNIQAWGDLAAARRSAARQAREITKQIETLTTQAELERALADDVTKSFQEREQAAARAGELQVQLSEKQISLARNRLNLINMEIDMRRANGEEIENLLDQQLSAYQELNQAQREFALAQRDVERTQAELVQDRLERDLDILIDGFDNQKTINERKIADDQRTFAERERILRKTEQLAFRNFPGFRLMQMP